MTNKSISANFLGMAKGIAIGTSTVIASLVLQGCSGDSTSPSTIEPTASSSMAPRSSVTPTSAPMPTATATATATTNTAPSDDTSPPASELLPQIAKSLRTVITNKTITNLEATVPPQCYTKTDSKFNPCYTCHQMYDRKAEDRLNRLDDGSLQGGYMFSDIGVSNHWDNLFVDRTAWLEQVSDTAIQEYVATENYSSLEARLVDTGWQGFIPDLDNYHLAAAAFDDRGLAKDGSFWVAFNYKPFPGTFWPTNGSTDDVVIRLPAAFRELNGEFNRDIYYLNLTLIELNLKNDAQTTLWPIDENAIGFDIDNNGVLEVTSTVTKSANYVGDAATTTIEFQQFPTGTEFMHSVRYLGVDAEHVITIPERMKELRYMKKVATLSRGELNGRYDNERKEKLLGELPNFINRRDLGLDNGLGWFVQGFIEDYDGELRPQSFEETMFCMGCHTAIGTTIDSTFSFARKLSGAASWGYINLHGMADAPNRSESGGEIINYLLRSGGGNEFRQNPEMISKWLNRDGTVKPAAHSADVYELLAPSKPRALKLNKAYTHIVRHQNFIEGRDATWLVSPNILRAVDEDIPPLASEYRFYQWDIRLNWQTGSDTQLP